MSGTRGPGFDSVAMEIPTTGVSPMDLMPGPKVIITIATDRALPCDDNQLLAQCLDALESLVEEFDLPILLMQGEVAP